MPRRKLALYTLLYIAGITAGFFVYERSRIIEAAGLCAAVLAAVFFTDADEQPLVRRQKKILAMMFLAGFVIFSFRAAAYSRSLSYVYEKDHVRGRVTSVSVRDDKIRLIVKSDETGPSRILITLDEDAASRSAAHAGCRTSEALERYGAYGYTGALIEAKGEYAEIPAAEDPGCFDYSLYMKSKGVTVRFKAYIVNVTGTETYAGTEVRMFLYDARENFISRFDEDTQGFIRGVIFGDKSGIDDDILEEFNNNSTGHILAVSGLHMGFLYSLLRFLTARKRTLPVSMIITAVILLYGEMTMWSPSTSRACIVLTVSLMASHLRRHSDLLTSISLAALIILTYEPYQLFASGFQLSFLALCGIAFLTGPLSRVTGEALAVMFAVQFATIPVIAYSYCRINPLSMLINIPVILLASVLVPVCILLLMAEIAAGRVPSTGIDLAELISYAVIKTNHFLSLDGGFSVKTAGPGAAAIITIYMFVFGLSSEWARIKLLRKEYGTVIKQGVLLLMPALMLSACLYDSISDDEIVFVSVRQGDCVHIRAEDHDALIDGGGQPDCGSSEEEKSEGYNVGRNILMPYLIHSGADAVDIALVTHLHADHYKGIEELSEEFPVGAIGIPADYRGAAGNMFDRSKIHYIEPYTKVEISDDVSVEAIWPAEASDEPIDADDPNEHNTVYMIRYKEIKIMVTGDLLEEDELDMVEYYEGTDMLKCDILKVAHHGSKSSSSEAFLDAAKPSIAVIQCGLHNFYGHPHEQTLERLEERGIKVFRTDLSGAVGIDMHGSRLSVDLFKKRGIM